MKIKVESWKWVDEESQKVLTRLGINECNLVKTKISEPMILIVKDL